MLFKNRFDAAEQLAKKLQKYRGNKNALILAVPRGALQIGAVLAKKLDLPLDIVSAKKIGHPYNPELAVGAVSLKGEFIDNQFRELSKEYIHEKIKEIRKKLEAMAVKYRGEKTALEIKGKIAIIVDDGVAMGHTMSAAIDMVRKEKAKKIVIAVPVGSSSSMDGLRKQVDEIICLSEPEFFVAIGQFYHKFEQVSDAQAIRLLKEAKR